MTRFTRAAQAFSVAETPDSATPDFEVGTSGQVTVQDLRLKTATVAAAGTVQGDATAISTGFTLVSGADAAKGVLLPAAEAGKVVIIKNGAAAILKVWPASGDAINALAANANYVLAASTSTILVAYDATTWYSVPLLAS